MPPRIVRAPPHGSAGHLTLDIRWRQILIGYPGDVFAYHHRILLVRISGSRWIVATPTGDVHEEDFEGCDVVPLGRNAQFPLDGRPFFCFRTVDENEAAEFHARAVELADVLGVAVQFFDENFANIFEINGRNGVLQFAQFEDKRLGNQVRPHTQQLTKLHPSGTELFGREADAFPF